MNLSELKQLEEAKRDAAYDPAERWRHIQEAITWAEANLPPEQRRNRPRQPKTIDASSGPGPEEVLQTGKVFPT